MSLHPLAQSSFFFLVADLEQLLNHIVAEHVRHELVQIRDDLFEELMPCRIGDDAQLLLDEARSVLITAESDDVTFDFLHSKPCLQQFRKLTGRCHCLVTFDKR